MTATQRAIADRLTTQLPDIDADETSEWPESLDGVVEAAARYRLDDSDCFLVGISAGGDS